MAHPSSAVALEWDPGDEARGRETAEDHFSRKQITVEEVEQVFANGPVWLPNKKGRRGNWRMLGRTDGGRPLDVMVLWEEDRRVLWPITGWRASDADVGRYL